MDDVIYVSIAIERWSTNPDEVLELGIAVFDTGILPPLGFQCRSPQTVVDVVFTNVQHFHCRTVEHARHVSKDQELSSRPAHFGFRTPVWVKTGDLGSILKRLFDDPTRLPDITNFEFAIPKQNRKIVCVNFCQMKHEMNWEYISRLDIKEPDLFAMFHMDSLCDDENVSLATLLAALRLQPVNLWNSGNSTAYILQAMVMAAVLECHGLGLVQACINAIEEEPDEVNTEDEAPVTWGGTTVEDDEVKLAMSKGRTKALKGSAGTWATIRMHNDIKWRAIQEREQQAKLKQKLYPEAGPSFAKSKPLPPRRKAAGRNEEKRNGRSGTPEPEVVVKKQDSSPARKTTWDTPGQAGRMLHSLGRR
jgi:hypothetical protein